MTSPTPRFAVIGLGLRMAFVLSAMRDIGWEFDIAGHCDPGPVGLPILQSKGIEIGTAYDDVAGLLDAGPFDLVLIGSPNHLHLAHLLSAIDAGWPIFAEKPVVRTIEESIALARRLGQGDCPPIHIGLVARSAPSIQDVIRRVDGGEIGEIVSFDATDHLPPAHGGYIARNWRRRGEWGGSYLLDKMCHDFDLFQRIIGARPARTASFGGRRLFGADAEHRPDIEDDAHGGFLKAFAGWNAAANSCAADRDIVDHQVAIVEYANGVRLSLHSNTKTALPERRWYIAGTRGTMLLDFGTLTLTIARDGEAEPERVSWEIDPEKMHGGADHAMAEALFASLKNERAYPVTVRESLEAGLAVMAIDRALEIGTVFDCSEMWRAFDHAMTGEAQPAMA